MNQCIEGGSETVPPATSVYLFIYLSSSTVCTSTHTHTYCRTTFLTPNFSICPNAIHFPECETHAQIEKGQQAAKEIKMQIQEIESAGQLPVAVHRERLNRALT